MKKQLIMLVLISTVLTASAQINVNLALSNRPQPWPSEWANPINGQLIISFMQGPIAADPNIKLRTTLIDESGTILAISNTSSARIYRLRDGANQFSIADVLQLENLALFGSAKTLLERTGRLAAGQYQLTVEVLNTAGDVVRAKQTKPFFITSYQLPLLTSPQNEANLDARIAQNTIVFRWTSLVPGTPELPIYRVQVFEILPGQTPLQAFRGNRPLLNDVVTKGMTQYIWRPNLPMLDSTANKRFIWTIQTIDKNGMPIPGLDQTVQGRSEPAIFNIIRTKTPGKQLHATEN